MGSNPRVAVAFTRNAVRGALLRAVLAVAILAAVTASPARRFTRADWGTLEHFAEFCRRFLTLDNGRPLELESFQRLVLADYFNGVSELLVLLPKKNGKTTLFAALALYHLIYTTDAACYIAASSRDQATIMFDQVKGFVRRRDTHGQFLPGAVWLQERVKIQEGYRRIKSLNDEGVVQVLAADDDTADGLIPTLALVDELHRHKDNGALYGVLADGIGARDGQILTISTAGERMKSVLGRLRKKAMQLPGASRDGCYVHARSPNGMFALHEWSLRPEDDRDDIALVKRANPLASNTLEKLEARKASPTMTPSRWARFGCGVWMQGEDAAISGLDWSKRGRGDVELDKGLELWIGLDVGWSHDTTAVVPFQVLEAPKLVMDPEEDEPRLAGRGRFGVPTVLWPPRDGSRQPRQAIIHAILAFKQDGYRVRSVVFDRNADTESIATDLETLHGLDVVEHSQDPAPMSEACMGLAAAIGEDGEIEHPEDDEFTAHILACKAKTTSGERWRFVPPTQNRGARKTGRADNPDEVEVIDAAIAAAIVHHVAMATAAADAEQRGPRPPAFEVI